MTMKAFRLGRLFFVSMDEMKERAHPIDLASSSCDMRAWYLASCKTWAKASAKYGIFFMMP